MDRSRRWLAVVPVPYNGFKASLTARSSSTLSGSLNRKALVVTRVFPSLIFLFAGVGWCFQESDVPIQFDHKIFNGATGITSQAGQIQVSLELPKTPTGPKWTGDRPNPPLSTAEAIRLATKKLNGLVQDTDEFYWGLVSASVVPWRYQDGYWYWQITFERHVKRGGSSGWPPEIRLVVLMDGTVVEPQISERER